MSLIGIVLAEEEIVDSLTTTTTTITEEGVVVVSPGFSISLECSIWYPGYTAQEVSEELYPDQSDTEDIAYEYNFVHSVLSGMRSFLCSNDDSSFTGKIILIDGQDGQDDLCSADNWDDRISITSNLLPNATRTTTISSISNDTTITLGTVMVEDQGDQDDLAWTVWTITYHVSQVSTSWLDSPIPSDDNSTAIQQSLQESLQQALNQTITDGTMDEQLQENLYSTRVRVSVVGNESSTFESSWNALVREYDYSDIAIILRYIGIGMLILNTLTVIVISTLAKRRRVESALEELQTQGNKQSSNQQGTQAGEVEVLLTSEDTVNKMLSLGQQESVKALAGDSRVLRVAPRVDRPQRNRFP